MKFYAESPESATLAAILSTMGHVLHTIDRESEPGKAVHAVKGEIFCRCPTRWKPALERAGGDERNAGRLLAQDGVDFVLDGPAVVDVPVFSSSDMARVMEFVR
jgi:hypothetical protein